MWKAVSEDSVAEVRKRVAELTTTADTVRLEMTAVETEKGAKAKSEAMAMAETMAQMSAKIVTLEAQNAELKQQAAAAERDKASLALRVAEAALRKKERLHN